MAELARTTRNGRSPECKAAYQVGRDDQCPLEGRLTGSWPLDTDPLGRSDLSDDRHSVRREVGAEVCRSPRRARQFASLAEAQVRCGGDQPREWKDRLGESRPRGSPHRGRPSNSQPGVSITSDGWRTSLRLFRLAGTLLPNARRRVGVEEALWSDAYQAWPR